MGPNKLCVHDTDFAMTKHNLDNGRIQHHSDEQNQTSVDTSSHRLLETSGALLPLPLTHNGRPNCASKHQVLAIKTGVVS